MSIIGRSAEQQRLLSKLHTNKSELIAVLGRRRVGKTFLVRQTFENSILFQFTGLQKSNLKDQLERFTTALNAQKTSTNEIPKSWFQAFDLLQQVILKSKSKKKKVIFLDEFPWMAGNKSKFLTAFTDFWNSFATTRTDILLIICGSSASWMINKVLKNKGGLHNRVTDRIILEPFTLFETRKFLQKKGVQASNLEIVKLYMVLGGIPFYLDQIETGESIPQAIQRICFKKNALLRLEYNELLPSLFDNASKHIKIVELLAKNPKGMQREVLLQKSKLLSGGGFTTILEELEHSGFISASIPFAKKINEKIYQLTDLYTLFYLKYLSNASSKKTNNWLQMYNTSLVQSWCGYAFEYVCMQHKNQIKKALKIEGINTHFSTWQTSATDDVKGAQIDMLVDRQDATINICEIKFKESPYIITADYVSKLRLKLTAFEHVEKIKKTCLLTFISPFGATQNKHSIGFVQNQIMLEHLFAE